MRHQQVSMRTFSLLFFLLLLAGQAMAGGKISGKVSDEKTGEPIIGATVVIKGTTAGSVTDIDGNFQIATDGGTFTVEVKYMGYTPKEVDDVKVANAGVTTLNVTLTESKSTQLGEVVVRSSLKKENISALYTIQKNAATISDGISADVIRKSPDRSTGEVLKRVSGTTIQDNKFVIVRGLSDRYNTALIDNSILPSTEPNRKAFSFDIVPAAMIDNIVISKAGTPDMPGDFAGGIINILTKETPDQNFNSLALGFQYNTVATGRNFKSGYRTSTDFLGFDNGSRQLPNSFPSVSKAQNGLSNQQGISALKSLNNDFTIREHRALPGVNFQGALGRIYRLRNNNKLGITGAVTYTHTELMKKDLVRQYDNFDYQDNVYIYSSNLGGLLNAGYYFGANKIVFKTLYNRIFDDNFLERKGINYSSTSDVRYYAYDLVQKSLLKTSVEGEHQIGSRQSKLGWLVSFNNVGNNQPDQRKVSYSRLLGSNNLFSADNTSLGKANNRLFGNLNENIINGAINYSLPLEVAGSKSTVKIGLFTQYRTRDFSNRYIGAVIDPSYPNADEIRTRPVDQLFSPALISSGAYYLNDLTLPADAYNATVNTNAAYLMLDNKIAEDIRIVWGARFESYALDLRSGKDVHVNPTWNDLLPSANITYSLTPKTNLRASYFRSVARPELREIAPLSYYDYELNANLNGNINLKRSQIDNLDFRYEVYPNPGEIISASVFYKKFNQTIENTVYGQLSSYDVTTENYGKAENLGVEVEIRKSLKSIASSSFLKDMTFYANLAYIHSRVKLNQASEINGHTFTERPLSGQSPYVINTSLGYATPDGKLSVNLLYNRIGQRLFLVGQSLKGNVYESPRNLLDFQASYAFSKKSELRLNVKDMLNNPVRLYFDQNNNGKFDGTKFANGNINPTEDWIYQEFKPGTSVSLTFSYRFP